MTSTPFRIPPAYVQWAQRSNLHPQEYTGVITYWPFKFAFAKYANANTTDLAYPLLTKNPYPLSAKQHHFEEFLSYPWRHADDTCQDIPEEKASQVLMESFEGYITGEIYMENILGFDNGDGDSWLQGVPPKYQD